MDMEQAATWLSGSILVMLGCIVIVVALVVINNILHKYWKPVKFFTQDSFNLNPPTRFMTEQEAQALKEDPKMGDFGKTKS